MHFVLYYHSTNFISQVSVFFNEPLNSKWKIYWLIWIPGIHNIHSCPHTFFRHSYKTVGCAFTRPITFIFTYIICSSSYVNQITDLTFYGLNFDCEIFNIVSIFESIQWFLLSDTCVEIFIKLQCFSRETGKISNIIKTLSVEKVKFLKSEFFKMIQMICFLDLWQKCCDFNYCKAR